MSDFSNYAESGILDHLFRESTFSKPTVIAVALTTNAPTDSDTGVTMSEVVDAGAYARVVHSGNLNLDEPAAAGTTTNTTVITFPTATADWGYVSGVVLCDTEAHGTGNSLLYGTLGTPKIVANGETFSFPATNLDVQLS